MKKIILPVLLFTCWIVLLSVDVPVGGNFLPSTGRFLSPFDGVWQSVKVNESSFDLVTPTKGAVRIMFDERAIPHIYANNIEDAIFAQGYLHASNRLFAMDLSTRSAAGRLSEVVGERALAHDHQQRERGLPWSAEMRVSSWENDEVNKKIINAYVRGVNSYIESLNYEDWPIEYKILSYPPVTWTSMHTALMATNMAVVLCMMEKDLDYTKAKNALSPEEFRYLYPDHNPLESPVIPSEKKWDFSSALIDSIATPTSQKFIDKKTADTKNEDINGSNNWAVSPSRTANGFALLANDPHLGLTLPNIWYEMEIHTPDMSVHGVSIPGLPFIIVGFNESIAWGTTNSGQDVLDWYTITWQDSSRLAYKLDGKFVNATLRPEEIKIRGRQTILDTVRYTHWGPVISIGDKKDMAMKWIGHERAGTNDLIYLELMNRAKNVEDYRQSVQAYQFPSQNKVFASVDGDIAISVAGAIPIRSSGTGVYVMEGDTKALEWKGYVPFDHAPFIINPHRGYVSSANQVPTDTNYPYDMPGTRIYEDYRGRVINMVLDTSDRLTVEDMKSLQQNNYNLHAAELLPELLGLLGHANCITEEEKIFAEKLRGWNYQQHRDSISPVFFELWYKEFEDLWFDELDSLQLMHPEDWRIVEMIKEPGQNRYTDIISTTTEREQLTDIVCISFSSMVKTFLVLEANERENWGSYKATEIPHLARLGPFGVSQLHTSGSKHIVNAMGKTHGPSWRMIVELSNPPKAHVNYPGGQSGNPASPHYSDMLEQFFEGKYYEVSLKKDPASWTPFREINMHPG